MATTNEFKKLNGNDCSVFVSNVSSKKTRVSIVKGVSARNCNDGELLFQKTYNSWNSVPEQDISAAYEAVGVANPNDASIY